MRRSLTAADVRHLVALYDSEIRFTDLHVGRLLDEVRRLGLDDRTVVVVTADHGEEFMERGWIGHTLSLHRELLHVPLIVRLPGAGPAVAEAPIGLVDLMPTLLRHLAVEPPPALEGTAIDLHHPADLGLRPAFSETANPQVQQGGRVPPVDLRSVLLGRLKLIEDRVAGRAELFDLGADSRETLDLAAERPEERGQLGAILDTWAAHCARKRSGQPAPPLEETLTPEQIEALRSLGYVD
jgi:arylsulfatase A-like enzyme